MTHNNNTDYKALIKLLFGCTSKYENAEEIFNLAKNNKNIIDILIDISQQNFIHNHDTIIFALAIFAHHGKSLSLRQKAFNSVVNICIEFEDLLKFIKFSKQIVRNSKCWSQMMRYAIRNWYDNTISSKLVSSITKSPDLHKKVLKNIRYSPSKYILQLLFKYIKYGWTSICNTSNNDIEQVFLDIKAFEYAKTATEDQLIYLIQNYRLDAEHIPLSMLSSSRVWKAILENMSVIEILQNFNNFINVRLFDHPTAVNIVIKLLSHKNTYNINSFVILTVWQTYAKGNHNNNTWLPNKQIIDVLCYAFYNSISDIIPTNKRLMVVLDILPSITLQAIKGFGSLTFYDIAIAMAMIIAQIENNPYIIGSRKQIYKLDIERIDSLRSIKNKIANLSCVINSEEKIKPVSPYSDPIMYALSNKINIDAFIIYYTNKESYNLHKSLYKLKEYRTKININAKLIIVKMSEEKYKIANFTDSGLLEIVGFDITTPEIIRRFICGDF